MDSPSKKFDLAPQGKVIKTLESPNGKNSQISILLAPVRKPAPGMPALSRIDSEGRGHNNDTNSILYTEATHITSFADLQV